MKNPMTFLMLFLLAFPAFAGGLQKLNSSVIPKEDLRDPIGALSPDKHLRIAVAFLLRDRTGAEKYLKALYDPGSPDYHHYLAPGEYAKRFGPSQPDYDRVTTFFKKAGFKVITSPDRFLLDLDGTVKMVELAFHTHIRLYQHPKEDRRFYAPDQAPSIEVDIPISGVYGLDNFKNPHSLKGHVQIVKAMPEKK